MFVKRTSKGKGIYSVRIVRSIRKGTRVFQKNIKIIGQASEEAQLRALERAAKEIILILQKKENKPSPSLKNRSPIPEHIKASNLKNTQLIKNGIFDIFGHYYDLFGFSSFIEQTYKDDQWNTILKFLILSRISCPESKRRTAQRLSEEYLVSVPLEKIYRTMDRALPVKDKIQSIIYERTKKYHCGKISVMLFDVTTLYFESIVQDELKDFGFGKDGKFNEVQIVLSLFATEKGLPLGYMLFPGNTGEGTTLIQHIQEIEKKFNAQKITLIADRAMFTEKNLSQLEERNIHYIVACKLKMLSNEKKEKILTDSDFRADLIQNDLHWIKEYDLKNRRLIVSYSCKRARRDQKMRERQIKKIHAKAKDGKVSLSKLLGNSSTKKFLHIKSEKLEIDCKKIQKLAQWDGIHGVITSLKNQNASSILTRYRQLWRIEEVFRISKHDLKMRPIFHWKEERIKAHILLCFVALALSKFVLEEMRNSTDLDLKNISFQRLVDSLESVQSALMRDQTGEEKDLYIFPKELDPLQEKIYKAASVVWSSRPWRI